MPRREDEDFTQPRDDRGFQAAGDPTKFSGPKSFFRIIAQNSIYRVGQLQRSSFPDVMPQNLSSLGAQVSAHTHGFVGTNAELRLSICLTKEIRCGVFESFGVIFFFLFPASKDQEPKHRGALFQESGSQGNAGVACRTSNGMVRR